MKELQEMALKMQEKFLAKSEIATIESINKEIEKYNKLAEAIARAKEGKTTSALTISEATKETANQEVKAVNITINGDVSGEEVVEKVKNGIMGELDLNTKLSNI